MSEASSDLRLPATPIPHRGFIPFFAEPAEGTSDTYRGFGAAAGRHERGGDLRLTATPTRGGCMPFVGSLLGGPLLWGMMGQPSEDDGSEPKLERVSFGFDLILFQNMDKKLL